MKYKTDFVTNSFSTNWICYGSFSDKLLEVVNVLIMIVLGRKRVR